MISQNNKILILLLISILINYYTPVPYLGFDYSRRHSIINRLYLSIFSALIIILTEVIISKDELTTKSLAIWILLLILGISVCYYFIANQIFIGEHEYLLTMLENHKMDVHITNSVLKNDKLDLEALEYSKKIIFARNEELKNIRELLSKKYNDK